MHLPPSMHLTRSKAPTLIEVGFGQISGKNTDPGRATQFDGRQGIVSRPRKSIMPDSHLEFYPHHGEPIDGFDSST